MSVILDVAIATRNRDTFVESLANMAAQSIAPRTRIYLLDGNDDERVARHLATRDWPFAGIELRRDADVLQQGEPPTWPRLYNPLLFAGDAPYVTYWSDDVEVSPTDAWERACTRLDSDPSLGAAVFASVDYPSTEPRLPARGFGLTLHYGVMRRQAFEAVGGLDEAYWFWYADNDLVLKMRAAGWRLVGLPECSVINFRNKLWRNPLIGDMRDVQLFNDRWSDFVQANRELLMGPNV